MAQAGWSWRPFAALFFRNWLDQVASCRETADPALAWLFNEGVSERCLHPTVLLEATDRPHLLAEALRHLTSAGIDVCSARIQSRTPKMDVVSIELDDPASPAAERAAARLVELPGVRRAAYRLPGGSGGILRQARDPSPKSAISSIDERGTFSDGAERCRRVRLLMGEAPG